MAVFYLLETLVLKGWDISSNYKMSLSSESAINYWILFPTLSHKCYIYYIWYSETFIAFKSVIKCINFMFFLFKPFWSDENKEFLLASYLFFPLWKASMNRELKLQWEKEQPHQLVNSTFSHIFITTSVMPSFFGW